METNSGSGMLHRKYLVWATVFGVAIVFSLAGMHSQPAHWGLYIQMPGIVVGLFTGWALGSYSPGITRSVVLGLTILSNAYVYYGLISLILFFKRLLKR